MNKNRKKKALKIEKILRLPGCSNHRNHDLGLINNFFFLMWFVLAEQDGKRRFFVYNIISRLQNLKKVNLFINV